MGNKSSEKRETNYFNALASRETFFKKHALWTSLFVIPLLVAIAFGASLNNGFVWDDETFIVNNEFVHDLSRWPQYFIVPESISSDPILSRMYRPLQTTSFALDARLWDNWAGGFHLTSLLLHIASCSAIIFVFRTLLGIKTAVVAACIFAIHPAVSEGVLSLASRGNQLYTLFSLLSLGFFIRISKGFDKNHILSILTMTLALFSKEPAIALIAILPFIQSVFGRPWGIRARQSVLLYVPFLIVAALYLIMRSLVVDTTKVIPYWGGSLWATILMQSKVFIIYLYLLILPFNLKGRYSVSPPDPFPDLLVIGALILNIALIILAIVIHRSGFKGKLLSLAVAWFYISLLPVANLIPVPGSMMGERFIYFTFAGIIPLLTGAGQDSGWRRFKNMVLILGTGILIAWLITDISRTSDWKDNKKFFTVLSEQEPNNPVVQVRMAQEELASNNIPSALNRLERIINADITLPLPEDRVKLHFWYGKALLYAGQPHKAYREFRLVANLQSEHSRDFILLFAEAAARSGDLTKAHHMLEREVKKFPEDDALLNGLGNVLMMMGDVSQAISFYKNALEINPNNKEAASNLQSAMELEKPE